MATAKQRKAFTAVYAAALNGAMIIGETLEAEKQFVTHLFFVTQGGEARIVQWAHPDPPNKAPNVVQGLVRDHDAVAAVAVFAAWGLDPEGLKDSVVVYGTFPQDDTERVVVLLREVDGLHPKAATVPDDLLKWMKEALPA